VDHHLLKTRIGRPLFPFALALLIAAAAPGIAAQPLPDSVRSPDLSAACRGDGSAFSLYLLNGSIESRPIEATRRAGLSPIAQSAYRLVEDHLQPYADPQVRSTWAERYRYALLQPSLPVTIVPDTSFDRWARTGYALDAGWDDPPVVRRTEIDPFRPRLDSDTHTLLFASPPRHRALRDFLLPLGVRDADRMNRRVDCVHRAVGLVDRGRTSDDLHSPPDLSLTMNERRTRAIAAYGWGQRGGVWVLYRRPSTGAPWSEIRPIGAWQYQP
jgi:hypothetical protein